MLLYPKNAIHCGSKSCQLTLAFLGDSDGGLLELKFFEVQCFSSSLFQPLAILNVRAVFVLFRLMDDWND